MHKMNALLRSLRKSEETPSCSQTPLQKIIPGNRPLAFAMRGDIKVDVEGPILVRTSSKMTKYLAGLITAKLLLRYPNWSGAGPYLLAYITSELKSNLPLFSQRKDSRVDRVACILRLAVYTAASCVTSTVCEETVVLDNSWEMVGEMPYPLIISTSGEVKVEAFPIKDRDGLRNKGFRPIPYPGSKWNEKWKTLEFVFERSGDDLIAVAKTYSGVIKGGLEEIEPTAPPSYLLAVEQKELSER
ncbi:putative matrix protein [Alphahymrhavirus distinguendus]|uniref:Matrix protein n=1 Tax=Lariophagus distinguendus negative-strand RNA virus 1 TaxID=2848911 RepID=A0A8F2J107_9VIRU|nr:putative matrix protein [Lariophagus distinguendus negative-strand RNA virus 1]